jgi:hypothetical protein
MKLSDAVKALRAAGDPGMTDFGRTALLSAAREFAGRSHDEALLPAVGEAFPRLEKDGKTTVFQILTAIRTVRAAELYASLLVDHGAEVNGSWLATFEFTKETGDGRIAKALFPKLFEAAKHRGIAADVYVTCLSACQAGLITGDVLDGHEGEFAQRLKVEQAAALPMQRDAGHNWKYEEAYDGPRELLGVMLDLAGYMRGDASLRALQLCADSKDPYHRLYRAISLLRRKQEVPDGELAWIASHGRERLTLWKHLTDLGLNDRLPEQCRDQVKLAESDMIGWLCFGTELGREPDEIELLTKEVRGEPGEDGRKRLVEYFFFKFRVVEDHWSKKDGWMVGMAGGYSKDEEPTGSGGSGTFSKFAKLDAKSLKEHVADYLSEK